MDDHERTEQALRHEIAALRQRLAALEATQADQDIIGGIPSGLFVYAYEPPDTLRLLSANPAAERLTGIVAEQQRGNTFEEIWPGARAAGITESFLNALRTGEPYRVEDLPYADGRIEGTYTTSAFRLPGNRLAVAFEDTTRRTVALHALQEREYLFTLLTESIGDLFWISTRDMRRNLYISPAYASLWGRSIEELRENPRTYFDAIHPDDRPGVAEILARHKRDGQPYECEYRVVRPDGSIHWVRERGFPVPARGSDGPLSAGVCTDISASRFAEIGRQESETTLQTLLQAAPAGIGFVRDRVIQWTNDRFARMLGYTPQELVGQNARLTYGSDEEYARVARVKHPQIQATGTGTIETQLMRRDGVMLDILLSSSAIDRNDLSQGLVFTALDMTARKRAENMLRAVNRAALAMQLALNHDGINEAIAHEMTQLGLGYVLLLVDDDEKLSLRFISQDHETIRRGEWLAGRSRADLRLTLSALDPSGQAAIEEHKTILVTNGVGVLSSVLGNLPKEKLAEIARMMDLERFLLAPLAIGGRVMGLLIVHASHLVEQDAPAITALAHQMAAAWAKVDLMDDLRESVESLQNTRSQLLQAQKMEAMGRLAGGIAHDFNNLLTVINGYSLMASETIQPDDPLQESLHMIQEAGDRAVGLTRQLLAFSRRQVLEPTLLNLNSVLTSMSKLVRRVIGEDVELVIELDQDLEPVLADANQIEQVILNLAVNARDAMPSGGVLSLSTANITVLDETMAARLGISRGRHVSLTVTDTGEGMSDDVQEHLFEPFFTTKAPGKGTGLGLSTVYGIVTQSGGTIQTHSTLGTGTTFRIWLPVATLGKVAQIETRNPIAVGGHETILVVEDDHGVRRLAASLLEKHGYVVLQASRAPEALVICETHDGSIDLVLTDVVMPEMSGKELVETLRHTHPLIGVVYMSGYSDDVLDTHDIRASGIPFIKKPFNMHRFSGQIRAALDA